MELSNQAMKVALRVITAISEHREADSADVAYLRSLAPLLSNAPVDELAREVIQQALKRRARVGGD
jgi:hypothetical protein